MVLHTGNDGDEPPELKRAEKDIIVSILRKDYARGVSIWEFADGPNGVGLGTIAQFYNGAAAWLFKNALRGEALDLLEKGDNELFGLGRP
jgi:hypothetical protein